MSVIDRVEFGAAGPDDAADLLALQRVAFASYAGMDPPSLTLTEDLADVRAALVAGGGVLGRLDGRVVAGLRLEPVGDEVWAHRVSVDPGSTGQGVGSALVRAALERATGLGFRRLRVVVRVSRPGNRRFFERLGFHAEAMRGEPPAWVELAVDLPVRRRLVVPTVQDMRALGRRLAGLLRAGDLVVLTGDLGAGKTTLTQGIGEGLGVSGPVLSPTFVLARVHRDGRLPLVHVDAYRLGSVAEVDDLDLDASTAESVTVVEWGEGLVEGLTADRLQVRLERAADSEVRTATLTGVGPRWTAPDALPALAGDDAEGLGG